MMASPLIEVKNLKKYFNVGARLTLKAVDDVNLQINQGETLGLVGESGCGKSTLGRTIVRLYEPTEGEIIFDGENITKVNRKKFSKNAQMIFQDPYASLDSRMTVSDIIGEGIDIHNLMRGKERAERIGNLLQIVGLLREHGNRFPHEFSGGQRQRIGIARALAIEPKFIVCDEPISALDVSIQAQVVNLLMKLQSNLGIAYLFIAHDLSMVKHISNNVAVMYLGKIVEMADSRELYKNPLHPYTKALLSSIPIPDPIVEKNRKQIPLEKEISSPINPKEICRFKERCSCIIKKCESEPPKLKDVGNGHKVACHLI